MGARNASGVRLMWGHLPDGAYRFLMEMAHTALDDDGRDIRTGEVIAARRWFGGEDLLVTYVRSHNDHGEVRSHAAKKSAAYRCLRQLVAAGAVKVVRAAVNGDRSWYALNVDPLGTEEFAALEHRAINRRPQSASQSNSQSASQSNSAPAPDAVDDGPAPDPRVRASRTLQSATQSDTESPSQSDTQSASQSNTLPICITQGGTQGATPEDNRPEVSTSPAVGVHVLVDGKTWADVPLLTVGTDGYDEAKSFLDRTIGTAAAATAVAGYMASGCPSYVDAVVTAAWNSGWEPEPPP